MKSKARAVVIGGGVGGASILYWLARLGWDDVVLSERADLPAPSLPFGWLDGPPGINRLIGVR